MPPARPVAAVDVPVPTHAAGTAPPEVEAEAGDAGRAAARTNPSPAEPGRGGGLVYVSVNVDGPSAPLFRDAEIPSAEPIVVDGGRSPLPAEPAALPPADEARPLATEAVGGDPFAGLLPLDAAALEAAAHEFLTRLAGLDGGPGGASGGSRNAVWYGAALLVAGGAVYAARRTSRPALDRVALGTSSVLARWERKDRRGHS